MASLLFFLAT